MNLIDLKTKERRKFLFHSLGIAIVAVWLILIGFLVKKVNFRETPEVTNSIQLSGKIASFQREWKEIYLKDRKVGYSTNMIKPFQNGYFIQEEIFLRLNLMGLASGVETLTQCRVDDRFIVESFFFKMTSGVVSFHVTGRVEDNHLLIETGEGRNKRSQRIKLPRPPMMGVGLSHFFKARKINVGETFKLPIFDPSTMAHRDAFIRVVGKERIKIKGRTYDVFRLETELWGRSMTFWLDEYGTTLKETGFMGLTVIKSSPASAPADIEDVEMDFYEMAAIKIDKELTNSKRLGYLKLKVEGMEKADLKSEILNIGRQRFHEGIIEITREKPPLKASYSLPYDAFSDEVKRLLEPEFNIESDVKEIVEKARQISGKDKDPLLVARKTLNWVYRKLDKKPIVTVPSALEVLKTKVGDCNEHAILLTALLRASGIPARLSIGLVYIRGKFLYHAWTEAYIGDWISMDATMNQMPVDATHIKLVEGNLDKQVEIVKYIGKMRLKVIDLRYD